MERLANNATSTLAAALSSGATTLTVAAAAAFPNAGNFRIKIDSELLLVTAVAGNVFTVTRGAEGTTAAAHTSGSAVKHVLTAASLETYVDERIEAADNGFDPTPLEEAIDALEADVAQLESDVADLTTEVSGKADAVHTHAQADVTGLVAALAGKAASSHTHAQSDVTGLTSTLAALAPLASPALTGMPTTPTPAVDDNTTQIPTTGWTLTQIANAVTGLVELKGSTDAAANPNYPAASKGDAYLISVSGKLGGASGKTVELGDFIVATADNAGGTEASVGTSWSVWQANLVGALLGANNLSDVADAATARTNLGLGTAATSATGDFAASSHTHAQSDVTNLVSDLAAKAATASPALTGTVVIRQTGGVAGTDEIQISHDGTNATIENKDGKLILKSASSGLYIGGVTSSDLLITVGGGFLKFRRGDNSNPFTTKLAFLMDNPTNSNAEVPNSYGYAFSSGSDPELAGPDTSLRRDSAGVLASKNGTGSAYGAFKATQFQSIIVTGTAPLTVASTTVVTNLNADKLDGFDASAFVRSDVDTTLGEGVDIATGTATGSKLGTAATQKLGFWGATPVVQPSGANQADISLDVDVAGSDTVDKAAINLNFAVLETLVRAMRQSLIDTGIIKGSS